MPHPLWSTVPIRSRYGHAFWLGFHHYLGTPEWQPLIASRQRRAGRSGNLCIYRSRRHLRAFWTGGDIAQQAMLSRHVKMHRQIVNSALRGSR